jgi:hypothetical protein
MHPALHFRRIAKAPLTQQVCGAEWSHLSDAQGIFDEACGPMASMDIPEPLRKFGGIAA